MNKDFDPEIYYNTQPEVEVDEYLQELYQEIDLENALEQGWEVKE